MQVQRVNNNQPNFQAVKISTVTSSAKKIEIFSVNETDKAFIDRMLNVVKGEKFLKDNRLFGGESIRQVYDAALKKAKNIKHWADDKVLIAVEDGKNILGIMDVEHSGDQIIKGLAVWNGSNLTRSSLVQAAVNDTNKMKNTALILPSENAPDIVKSFFRQMGFRVPKDDKNLMIECENFGEAQKKINNVFDLFEQKVKVKNTKKYDVDLAEYLKIDA